MHSLLERTNGWINCMHLPRSWQMHVCTNIKSNRRVRALYASYVLFDALTIAYNVKLNVEFLPLAIIILARPVPGTCHWHS